MKLSVIIISLIVIGILIGFAKKSGIKVISSFTSKTARMKVFEVLSDFESIPKWNPSVISSTVLSKPGSVGCEFLERRKELFRESDMRFQVLNCDPGHFIKVEGISGMTAITFEYEIQEENNQTNVKLTFLEMPKPILMSILLTPVYKKNIDANMMKLKALIEQ